MIETTRSSQFFHGGRVRLLETRCFLHERVLDEQRTAIERSTRATSTRYFIVDHTNHERTTGTPSRIFSAFQFFLEQQRTRLLRSRHDRTLLLLFEIYHHRDTASSTSPILRRIRNLNAADEKSVLPAWIDDYLLSQLRREKPFSECLTHTIDLEVDTRRERESPAYTTNIYITYSFRKQKINVYISRCNYSRRLQDGVRKRKGTVLCRYTDRRREMNALLLDSLHVTLFFLGRSTKKNRTSCGEDRDGHASSSRRTHHQLHLKESSTMRATSSTPRCSYLAAVRLPVATLRGEMFTIAVH